MFLFVFVSFVMVCVVLLVDLWCVGLVGWLVVRFGLGGEVVVDGDHGVLFVYLLVVFVVVCEMGEVLVVEGVVIFGGWCCDDDVMVLVGVELDDVGCLVLGFGCYVVGVVVDYVHWDVWYHECVVLEV